MTKEKGFNKHIWKIMMVLSIIFIIWTLFVISRGDEILPTAFKLAGSSQLTEDRRQFLPLLIPYEEDS